MNRQIKFRGKRTDNGEWVFGSLVILRDRYFIIPKESGCFRRSPYIPYRYKVIPDTVGQFVCMIPNTSMYVDNSRELYEGDLIRQKGDKTVYWVTFESCRFYGISNEGDKWGAFTCSLGEKKSLEKIEIIGNIHDSKELLTAK